LAFFDKDSSVMTLNKHSSKSLLIKATILSNYKNKFLRVKKNKVGLKDNGLVRFGKGYRAREARLSRVTLTQTLLARSRHLSTKRRLKLEVRLRYDNSSK